MHRMVLVSLAVSLFSGDHVIADTAFLYQGELTQDGEAASGSFDMEFSLWDAPTAGNQICCPVVVNDVQVFEERFSAQLDFGADAFDNTARWLELMVEGITLSPRQPIHRAPYSIQTRGIYVDENNRVGIGTTLPFGKLGIVAADTINGLHVENTNESAFADSAIYGIGVDAGGIFEATSSSSFAKAVHGTSINGFAGYFDGRGYFSGDVGLGTNSPTSPLHVVGTAHFEGRVGVGMENPVAKLEIVSDTAGTAAVAIRPTDAPVYGLLIEGSASQQSLYVTNYGDGDAARFIGDVEVSGNVGIGTIDPANPLYVESDSSAAAIVASNLGTGGALYAIGTREADVLGGLITAQNPGGSRLAIDGDEIGVWDGIFPSTLFLNKEGGDIVCGGAIDINFSIVTDGNEAVCPAGTKVLGGGCRIVGDAEVRASYPSGDAWHCVAGDVVGFVELEAYAICANVK